MKILLVLIVLLVLVAAAPVLARIGRVVCAWWTGREGAW